MKVILVLVLLHGCLGFEDSSTSQSHLQEEVCSIQHKEMGSIMREFSGLLKIKVGRMVIDWSKMVPPPPPPPPLPYIGHDYIHYMRRRRRRSSDPYPLIPIFYNKHPTKHTDCNKKFNAEIIKVFQKYPSYTTKLNQRDIITVFGSDMLQENTEFFATGTVGAVSCGDAWKVLSARKWDDLSSYQRDLLNDGTYLQNCGSNTEVLQECFKPPANRQSSLDKYASCSDRLSYCETFPDKTPAKLEKKNQREFNSCLNNVKVITPEPLTGPVA
uniref:Uncharacterized protein n=1 Tax=Magallana gigas TaxID=29159 RepID=A0A8W8LZ50_MAGGI